jgi:hypothetical protein
MKPTEFAFAPALRGGELAEGRAELAKHPGTAGVAHHDTGERKTTQGAVELVVEDYKIQERLSE